jgi:two-component system chemotaxis response regulator CheY
MPIVLIVDDSKMVRTMVREALEADVDRYTVVEACDGVEALELSERHNPDLIVTDINMPEMDGLALIRELRARPSFRLTPILVLSTEASDDIIRNGKDAGATGWLVKPFDPKSLRQTAELALALREKAIRKEASRT